MTAKDIAETVVGGFILLGMICASAIAIGCVVLVWRAVL